ncbi:MAG: ribosome assembly RNA-binding protein YhbY [Chromatiales bacterium]|jgi:RNA-binding protein|nr:MAG: ribosome assembly RNA-binding protein YhbY [Chromatiales bacterium]
MTATAKPLSEKQKKHLRGLAHALAPVSHLGNAGVTDAFLAELETTLAHHELIKLKVLAPDRTQRDTTIETLVERTGAIVITRIGNIAVLYRPNPGGPQLELPEN